MLFRTRRLTRTSASQLLRVGDLPDSITVPGARLAQRDPKYLGDRLCNRADELACVVVVVVVREESARGGRKSRDQWRVAAVKGTIGKARYKVALSNSHFDLMGVSCDERARDLHFQDEIDSGGSLVYRG